MYVYTHVCVDVYAYIMYVCVYACIFMHVYVHVWYARIVNMHNTFATFLIHGMYSVYAACK